MEVGSQGYINGLPSGWIDCHVAFLALRDRIRDALAGDDPAPWLATKSADYWGPISPDQIEGIKLGVRVAATFQRAFLSGALTPSAFTSDSLRVGFEIHESLANLRIMIMDAAA
jgi:hypothetical protein